MGRSPEILLRVRNFPGVISCACVRSPHLLSELPRTGGVFFLVCVIHPGIIPSASPARDTAEKAINATG